MKPLSAETLIQNRYKIVHLIGKGGMGEVYLAVDQRLGSAVALKRTFFSDDDMLASAFEREARILANLRHPILPKVSDHFIEGDNQFLVMEHIAGDDLSKRLENTQQSFPLSWVLFWADQLLDALHYLHSHQPPIIHRDIKPQNLKLTADNQIVLLDFGLSKNSVGDTHFNRTSNNTGSTGSVVGYTPHYAPMEQIRGTGTSAKSDLYSLSATLYQLLTNAVPPDALSRADSLLNGMPDPLKPVYELNKEVTPEVSKVILKGMEVSQDRRHESARQMQRRLRDAYAKLQTAMSAQTVAFNLDDQQIDLGDQPPVGAAGAEVPVFSAETQTAFPADSAEPDDSVPPPGGEPVPAGQPSVATQTPEKTPVDPPDFDATLKFDGEIAEPGEKQSDVKTEVLLDADNPAVASALESLGEPAAGEPSGQDVSGAPDAPVGQDEDVYDDESFVPESSEPVPDATVPLMDFGDIDQTGREAAAEEAADVPEIAGETDFFSIPATDAGEYDEEFGSSAADSDAPDSAATAAGFAGGTQFNESAATQTSAAGADSGRRAKSLVKKKKKSVVPIILGLGAVFFLLFGAVAGVGWYLFNNGNFFGGGTSDETPTPESSIEETFTPEPTAEEVIVTTPELTPDEPANTEEDDNTNTAETPDATDTPVTRTPTRKPPATRTPTRKPPRTPARKPPRTPTRKPPRTPPPKPKINP